jgi:ATP-dependent DNA helicase DinG
MSNIKEIIDNALDKKLFGKDFKFRTNQRETIEAICNLYLKDQEGTVILDAPTGTGKSIIALWSSYVLKELGNSGYLLTSDKSLQDQYEKDIIGFKTGWASVRGIDNYTCDLNGLSYSMGECKMRGYSMKQSLALQCSSTCGYIIGRQKAIHSPVTLANYSWWLIQQNYVNLKIAQHQASLEKSNTGPKALDTSIDLDEYDNFFPFRKRDFVFFDEAHKVDEIVQQHFSPVLKKNPLFLTVDLIDFLISEGIRTSTAGRTYIEGLIDDILFEKTNEGMFFKLNKLKTFLSGVLSKRKDLQKVSRHKFGRNVDKPLPKKWNKAFKHFDYMKDVHCKLEDYLEIIEKEGLQSMLFSKNIQEGEIKLMCLSEAAMIGKHLHQRAGFKIFMSATIGDPKTYIKVMGIENASVIKLSNDFNYEKSPIIFVNRFKMSMQHKEKSLPEAIKILDQILSKHKDQRGLIHTGSYEFTQYIKQHSNHIRRIIEYKNSSEKEDALIKFKKGVNGIIMGPSILEGLDFNDESCRFQIFFKIPFPSLGDPLTIAKMKGSPGWYDWKTGVTIEQGIGRSVRNSKDWAITYILDACFNNIMHKTDFLSEDLKNRIKVIK